MYEYARETFQMSDEEHAKFMAVAQEEKPPIPVLNVTVVEAQGLEAKDPNGFSDPYCMLGIQPDAEARRADGEDDSGTRRSLKRFGASFKKRDRKNPA
ncbi:BAI1-associated protein 3, partial [Stegodyphus mimosarum]